MDIETVVDREELKDLHYRYCYSIDSCDVEQFVDLFAEEGRLVVPSYEGDIVGEEGLRAFMADREAEDRNFSSHIPGTPRIEVAGDEATARWYVFVMVQYDDDDLIWGQSLQEAEYERRDGEWKITTMTASRQHTLDMTSLL